MDEEWELFTRAMKEQNVVGNSFSNDLSSTSVSDSLSKLKLSNRSDVLSVFVKIIECTRLHTNQKLEYLQKPSPRSITFVPQISEAIVEEEEEEKMAERNIQEIDDQL